MQNKKQKLSLDRPAIYHIKVNGILDKSWDYFGEKIQVTVNINEEGDIYSSLVCRVDQAALIGLLRQIYAMGIPLVSVICVDFS